MRQIWLALLAFFGVALIAAAIMIPTYLVDRLKVVPLDLDTTSAAETVSAGGSPSEQFPAVVFDRCSAGEDEAAQLEAAVAQQRRSVIVDPSDADTATLQSAQVLQILRTRNADGEENVPPFKPIEGPHSCDDGLLTANVDRVSVDRKTGVPTGDVSSLQMETTHDGSSLEEVSVDIGHRDGFQYKFPFGTEKRDYYIYDLNTRQDVVATFVGEREYDGVNTYEFRAEVPVTDISELPNPDGEAPLGMILNMPASWWGIEGEGIEPDDPVTMHRFATATLTRFVEPTTGQILDGVEEQRQFFASPDQTDNVPAAIRDFEMDALRGTFAWTPETVNEATQGAKDNIRMLNLANTVLPIVLGVIGALLLLLWGFLVFRGSKRDDEGGDDYAVDPDGPAPDDSQTAVLARPDAPATGAAAAGGAAGASGRHRPDPEDVVDAGDEPTTSLPPLPSDNPWERPTEQIPPVEDDPDGQTGPIQRPDA